VSPSLLFDGDQDVGVRDSSVTVEDRRLARLIPRRFNCSRQRKSPNYIIAEILLSSLYGDWIFGPTEDGVARSHQRPIRRRSR
jgi:hypothetical protein